MDLLIYFSNLIGDEANDRHELKSALGEITLNRFKDKRFERKAEVYNFTKGLQYLLGRGPMEYASIFKIFREIKLRDPQFKPQSFFDFGSGVGTGTWAAAEHWRDSLYEYFSVDQSADMNNIAEIVLRDGRENKAISLKGVFYRQFLPASDIVRKMAFVHFRFRDHDQQKVIVFLYKSNIFPSSTPSSTSPI